MNALAAVRFALVDVVANVLDGFLGYPAPALSLSVPAFVVGVPDLVTYNVTGSGRARYELPLACVVEVGNVLDLDAFLSADGPVVSVLDGLEHPAWLGQLKVRSGEGAQPVDNAGTPVIQATLTLVVIA